jgi:(p)ppGpp synthase/HD superfamily hydrolase
MDRIAAAFVFACNAHRSETRKGTNIPYLVHPMDVASLLIKSGASEDVVVAGFLHDVVEDTDIPLSTIREKFGENVAKLVEGASEPEDLKKDPDKKGTWRMRKQHTIEFIAVASRQMRMISCADKVANLNDMLTDKLALGEGLWAKFNAPKEEQAWYYRSLLEAFGKGPDSIADLPMYALMKGSVGTLFGE